MYSKADLFGFAEYYLRLHHRKMTMEEILFNYLKGHIKPQDLVEDDILPIKDVNEKVIIPPDYVLINVRDMACKLSGVTVKDVNSKKRNREFVEVRQMTCWIAVQMGYAPRDITRILKWDRSVTYQRVEKAEELASTIKEYRWRLNELAKRFGLNGFIA